MNTVTLSTVNCDYSDFEGKNWFGNSQKNKA